MDLQHWGVLSVICWMVTCPWEACQTLTTVLTQKPLRVAAPGSLSASSSCHHHVLPTSSCWPAPRLQLSAVPLCCRQPGYFWQQREQKSGLLCAQPKHSPAWKTCYQHAGGRGRTVLWDGRSWRVGGVSRAFRKGPREPSAKTKVGTGRRRGRGCGSELSHGLAAPRVSPALLRAQSSRSEGARAPARRWSPAGRCPPRGAEARYGREHRTQARHQGSYGHSRPVFKEDFGCLSASQSLLHTQGRGPL